MDSLSLRGNLGAVRQRRQDSQARDVLHLDKIAFAQEPVLGVKVLHVVRGGLGNSSEVIAIVFCGFFGTAEVVYVSEASEVVGGLAVFIHVVDVSKFQCAILTMLFIPFPQLVANADFWLAFLI